MAEMLQNIESIEQPVQMEQPVVQTEAPEAPAATEPTTASEEGPGPKAKAGAASTKKDETPLWDANMAYMNSARTEYTTLTQNFAIDVFKNLGVTPMYKGKPVTDLSKIAGIFSQDPKAAQEMYSQAQKALDNPNVDPDALINYYSKIYEIEINSGKILAANQMMGKDLLYAADNAYAASGQKNKLHDAHRVLLNADGTFKSKEQATKDLSAYRQKYISEAIKKAEESFREKNPSRVNQDGSLNLGTWMRSDMGSFIKPIIIRDPKTGKIETKRLDNPTYKGSVDDYSLTIESAVSGATGMMSRLNYDDLYDEIVKSYNQNSKTRRLTAAQQGMMQDNAGGGKAATNIFDQLDFDVDNYITRNNMGKPMMEYDPNLGKDSPINWKFRAAFDVIADAPKQEGAIIVNGNPAGGTSVPTKSDDNAVQLLALAKTEIQEYMKKISSKKNKGATNTQGRPAGKLNFQPVAFGDENYHAYHITFSSGFLDKHKGSEDSPGLTRDPKNKKKLLTEGITIVLPKASSANLSIGKQSIKGTEITPAEAIINLSPDGKFRFGVPGGGEINLERNEKGEYVFGGYNLVYNPNTYKYDTVPINPGRVAEPGGLDMDLDSRLLRSRDTLFNYLKANREIENFLRQQNGVKDPNKLTGQ